MKLVFGDRGGAELAAMVATAEGREKAREYTKMATWTWPSWLKKFTDDDIHAAITDAEKTARPEV